MICSVIGLGIDKSGLVMSSDLWLFLLPDKLMNSHLNIYLTMIFNKEVFV